MRDTAWWRVAKYREIFAKRYFACSREEENILPRDDLFGSEAARNVFGKFRKFSGLITDETSFCALYRFDAVVAHVVRCSFDITNDLNVPSRKNQEDEDNHLKVANAVAPQKIK